MKAKLSKSDLSRLAADKLPLPTEDETQRVIVDGLRAYGFIVSITSRRRKKCWHCGAWPKGGDGVTKGVADLLVRRPDWPVGIWVALEVKRPGAVQFSSTEQRSATIDGSILLVQSLEQAVEAVGRAL